ncbi:MAG: hypothetical protein AVDCRST_MAG03-2864, partial [uncultured Rubrobacteraceae bacterium]
EDQPHNPGHGGVAQRQLDHGRPLGPLPTGDGPQRAGRGGLERGTLRPDDRAPHQAQPPLHQ